MRVSLAVNGKWAGNGKNHSVEIFGTIFGSFEDVIESLAKLVVVSFY